MALMEQVSQKAKVRLPFAIDPSGKGFVAQIVDGVKSAVDDGFFAAGDLLPGRKDFARLLGVGEGTVRAAMRHLKSEGIVAVRRRTGCQVLDSKRLKCRGDVLVIATHLPGAFAFNVTVAMMGVVLFKAGYRMFSLFLDADVPRKDRLTSLRLAMDSDPLLVVGYSYPPSLNDIVKCAYAAGKPCVTPLWTPPRPRAGVYPMPVDASEARAVADLAAACRKARLHSVCQMHLGGMHVPFDIRPQLERDGVNVETISARPIDNPHCLENIQRSAHAAMRQRLLSGALPDLFFFTDDYLATGAMTALLEAGVSIPDEVRVVTFANRGLGPVMSKGFARIEHDPSSRGLSQGKALLSFLTTGSFQASDGDGAYSYVPGATFPG